MKPNTRTVLFLLLSACTLVVHAAESLSLIMPKPKSVVATRTTFALGRPVRISDPTNSELLASFFGQSVADAEATVTVQLVGPAELGTFDYTLAGFDNEGYHLSVGSNEIKITAVAKVGVIRAAQTLMQLAQATTAADVKQLPGCEITDYPAFKLRGFMHDVGRSFISFDELKHEIDLLSRFKVNAFHWHLTDNQGFRFESKVYPQLNKATAMTRFPGKYYTQAQCTELEAYAAERGLTIIPEIDMPGHSTAFTNAMGYNMNSTQGRAALKQLLKELADAFPLAPYIHIGCDEAGTSAEFVNEMTKYIKQELGRRCVVWNPISGVSISTATLPYIDMTQMWSTAGRKIAGLPNIDCRYNYVNHFDVFADLVGIYKSNIYYEQQGNPEVAGAITALWNDRKTPTETDIISQNNLYANALATAERGWMGGGRRYIEAGGTTLPGVGAEFDEFADWERRFLHYKESWLAQEPIPYVQQTNVKWRITDPFPNGSAASATFPPEQSTADVLPASYTYDGQTYGSALATGAGIYLRHTWGTTVPAFYTSPALNYTAYAWTYVYSPVEQEAGALIEFQNYGRSENDRAPDAGQWDRKGSRVWLNGTELKPPTWANSGKSINAEVALQNENFPAREPVSVQLRAGWNKVFLKLPYVTASGVRLNKWLFTFVLTTPDGRRALPGLIYSPSQDPEADLADEPLDPSDSPVTELQGKSMTMSSTAASALDFGQWYVMYDRGNGRGYLFENVQTHRLHNTATAPTGVATANARYLVRLVPAEEGKCYLQTGFGNYFGRIEQSTHVAVTAKPTEPLTVGLINNTKGHFYIQGSNGLILDCNDYSQGDDRATVVGWGSSVPTSTGGNNDWAFYPVSLEDGATASITASDVVVCQGHQTTGQGNTAQALLRMKMTPFNTFTPTQFNVRLAGASQMSRVAVYVTQTDQLHLPDAHPQLLGEATPEEGEFPIPVSGLTLTDGQSRYFWIAADVRPDATELAALDAAVTSIDYTNALGRQSLDITAKGNPDGAMCVYKRQAFLWTGSLAQQKYYRIPTIIRTADGGIVALADDRYDNTQDLGKAASGAAGNHKIDVVARKSMDDGLTWSEPVVVAAGDGSSAAACGYGDPAVVRTLSGKLICLMAAGNKSFPAGMLHMGYSESTDNGVTWSRPTDIYPAIRKNGLAITSAFTSSGKGVCMASGRVAFAMNGTVGGTCNEYILYSDDEGATWDIHPTMACASADESKLEIMNDNSLLLSVRQGGWNSMANRAWNRTTADAQTDGIGAWGAKRYWTDLNANGCNADILYYSRETEADGSRDLMLHTVVKTFNTYRRDLRLYMSFDQGTTWHEAFQLQPGFAAYSSMQRLANGDLAIVFEDGSLGNQDKMDCYAMTYIVLSRETIEARAGQVVEEAEAAANTVRIVYENSKETELGSWDNAGTRNVWTSSATTNAIGGLTLTKSAGTFDRYTGWNGFYNLAYRVGAANRDEVLTLTAPQGYLIKSYSLMAQEWTQGAANYTITADDGTSIQPRYQGGAAGYTPLTVADINAPTATIRVRSTNATQYLAIVNFTVTLTPFDTRVGHLRASGTTTASYNLAGQRIGPLITAPGVYIVDGKKMVRR